MEYERELEIDRLALDEEWSGQPLRMDEWAKRHADAILARDKAKLEYDTARAEADKRVREAFAQAGVKATEAMVDREVTLDPVVQDARIVLLEREHSVNVLMGTVMAFNARKAALENLVKLFLADYYGQPYVPDKPHAVRRAMNDVIVAEAESAQRENVQHVMRRARRVD